MKGVRYKPWPGRTREPLPLGPRGWKETGPIFFLFFGECFLEALKGQGPQYQGNTAVRPVSGCLRPAPEDKENRAFFPFFFDECFLEALKGQGPQY